MAHHLTKKKSRLQNTEKASVAAVVANNNETLSKLIAGEVTKLGFNGKNAKITAFENAQKEAATNASELMAEMKAEEGDFNIKRDILASQAIEKQQNISADNLRQTLSGTGEEFNFTKVGQHQTKPVVEEEPGIQFHSNATYTDATGTHRDALGQAITTDMNVNKITDDVAFAAQKAISEDVALERTVITEKAEYIDSHKYNRDGKGQIITNTPAHNQLHSEKTAAVVDHSISGNNQKVYAETLKLEADTKDSALQAKQLGDSTELNAEKDAASAVFMSNYNDDQVFNPSFDEALAREITNTTDKDLEETAAKKINEAKINEAEQKFQQQDIGADAYQATLEAEKARIAQTSATADGHFDKSLPPGGRDIKHSNAFLENKKQEEIDAYDASQGSIDKDAKIGLVTIENDENLEATASDLAIRTSDEVSAQLRADLDAQIKEEGLDATASDLAQESLSDKAKRELAEEKAKKQRESHDQFQNDRIDSIANASDEDAANKKQQALREKMATYDSSKYKSATSRPVEKTKIPDKYATFGDKRGNPDLLVGKDPFRFTTLTYPSEVTTSPEYGHYMLFYVNAQNKTKYKYHGYNDDGNYAVVGDVVETQSYTSEYAAASGDTGSDASTTTTVPKNHQYNTYYHYNTGANADEVAYQKQLSYSGVRGNVLQSNQVTLMRQRQPTEGVASRVDLTSRITDSVALYLPSDVQSNVSASYTGFDMGLLGFLALGGADIIKQVKDRDFEGAARNFIGTGERMLTEMIKKAGITAVDAAFGGTGGTEQVFNKVFGQTTNPFIEVAFNNMSLREFSYTFNFRPRSADETAEVKAIIQLFRFHMAPELKGTNHRYMTLPSTFDIHYMYQTDPETATENTFYNKIATCVLERCDVNYTPTGVKSFDDGAPTEISMALSFKETELLTKEKIDKGF